MTVLIVAVGTVRGPHEAAVHEYERRAARYWKLEVVEVQAGTSRRSRVQAEDVRRAEGERIVARIPEELEVVAVTRHGTARSSRELAAYLKELAVAGRPGVTFAVGGAFGLSEEVLSRAAMQLSLSRLTLPHELARVVLAEQLYRAGTILRGEPYHKEYG
ncbi:MAG: 23S rRNA (pseudouridine(1915)-N(3))-methyltransferase RlmH [Gemmatimonadetes bacterium]|nr:23S rRNA (pseudouridine(1915)-N(3))-methyltransferase RlmH [Gemmatimonadota bacterium]